MLSLLDRVLYGYSLDELYQLQANIDADLGVLEAAIDRFRGELLLLRDWEEGGRDALLDRLDAIGKPEGRNDGKEQT